MSIIQPHLKIGDNGALDDFLKTMLCNSHHGESYNLKTQQIPKYVTECDGYHVNATIKAGDVAVFDRPLYPLRYEPSLKLAIPMVLIVAVPLLFHGYNLVRYRAWWIASLTLGSLLWFLSFVIWAVMSANINVYGTFAAAIILNVATGPIVCVSMALCFHKLMHFGAAVSKDSYFRSAPNFAYLYITAFIFAWFFELIGYIGVIVQSGKNYSRHRFDFVVTGPTHGEYAGYTSYTDGVATFNAMFRWSYLLQWIADAAFGLHVVIYLYKTWRYYRLRSELNEWRWNIWAFFFISGLQAVNTDYWHTVAKEAFDARTGTSYFQTEWKFWVINFMPMTIVLYWSMLLNPARKYRNLVVPERRIGDRHGHQEK